MTQCLLLFSAGVLSVGFFPVLLPFWAALPAALIAAFCLFRYRDYRLLSLVFGLAWGTFSGGQLLQHQLPASMELQEFQVRGTVVDLPQNNDRRTRFQLQLESCTAVQTGQQLPLKKLLLSWYGERPEVFSGQHWQLRVKLRRPRGFANPGGFDYQHWLLQQGISATGYVRKGGDSQLLGVHDHWLRDQRQRLFRQIQGLELPELQRGLLLALVVGEGSSLGSDQWALFNRTGTTHLLIISGLHIGLFALLCYAMGNVLARPLNLLLPALPAQLWASVCALLGAGFYVALSGFGLPATRALAMVVAVLLVRWLRNSASPFSYLVAALAAVAVVDPLAAHSTGFWLSFTAVFGLLWVFAPLVGRLTGWRNFIHRWCRPQWTVFVVLAAPLLAAFGHLSLSSLAINTLAIPWLNFLVVPVCLLGVVISFVSPLAADWCWQLAGWQLQWFYLGLEWLGNNSGLLLSPSVPLSGVAVFLLLLAALVLLLPRGVPGRWLGVIPFALVFFASPQRPLLTATVLDVGQGLAVVVTTQNHTLVYDTGAAFSERFNAGSGVVAPFLRSRGITQVDRLVVSHADSDHAGGTQGLLSVMDVSDIWVGEPLPEVAGTKPCRAGSTWQWDGVLFDVLSPDEQQATGGNNGSCVILISAGKHRLLLPGDIEVERERGLLGQLAPVDIVVAPHHGSRTSSSDSFVARLAPDHVVYSAGYKHHFGHPHDTVVQRYTQINAQQWNTANDGAVTFELLGDRWVVHSERGGYRFFWQ